MQLMFNARSIMNSINRELLAYCSITSNQCPSQLLYFYIFIEYVKLAVDVFACVCIHVLPSNATGQLPFYSISAFPWCLLFSIHKTLGTINVII